MPILPVGSVVTILTPPTPRSSGAPARIFDTTVTTRQLSSRLSSVNRLDNCPIPARSCQKFGTSSSRAGRANSKKHLSRLPTNRA